MTTTIVQGDARALWRDLVQDGETRSATALEEEVEAYLVFVLMRYVGDATLLRRTMALELLDALQGAGRSRMDDLREVGDRCLLIAGWFPRLAARRRVGPRYFADVGRGAYGQLAEATRQATADLFAKLADAFDPMVAVLAHAAAVVQGDLKDCAPELAHRLRQAGPPHGRVH